LKELFTFSLGLKRKPELFLFGFDGLSDSVRIRLQELKMFSNRVLETIKLEDEESNKEKRVSLNSKEFIIPS
jgi:hypothetical protein